jgi:hypothetical protein
MFTLSTDRTTRNDSGLPGWLCTIGSVGGIYVRKSLCDGNLGSCANE